MNISELLLYIVILVLVLWRVVYRQLRGSTITIRGLTLIPVILVVLGVANCARVLPQASGREIALLVADLAILLVLGVARAASTRLGLRNGYAFQKGTSLTLVLWLVTVAIRVGFAAAGASLGAAGALTSASVLLSVGLSIGVQNVLIYQRARRRELPIAVRRVAAS
ncbi:MULTISPECIES: hypothetical protein [Amycolatopsis]|uniref:DUF1453 domain-containing protein n=2 Tax=Amycolatopsis TaxID=1813 RepID=A0A1I3Z1L5_9PSEU|nr:hypothetical protein [Amycolatopsis sacchari]SFK37499.1 hypothetical protein SAMN05421835_11992 [Amycolatopsis sacchari]